MKDPSRHPPSAFPCAHLYAAVLSTPPLGGRGVAGVGAEGAAHPVGLPRELGPHFPYPMAGKKRATYLEALPSCLIASGLVMVLATNTASNGGGGGGPTPCSLPLITQIRKPLCTGLLRAKVIS